MRLYDEVNENVSNSEQDPPNYTELNENINRLNENITLLNETLSPSTEETSEEVKEESPEELTTETLVVDSSVDSHLYLSGTVQNATIDDLYALALSGRNIILLFFLLLVLWKLWGALKNAIFRIMDK